MWEAQGTRGSSWGIKGYEIAKVYHDSIKIKEEKENYLIACHQKKAPKQRPVDKSAKRSDMLDQIMKHS